MDTHEQKILYESPSVEIHETRMRRILCASIAETEKWSSDMDGGEDLNF